MSLLTRYLDLKILHCDCGHASDEVMCYVLDNVEDRKKIHFPT